MAWMKRFPLWQRLFAFGLGLAVLAGASLAVWWRPARQRHMVAESPDRSQARPDAAVIPALDRDQPATETATLALG